MRLHPRVRDLSGSRFGRLLVLQPTEYRRHRSVVWRCRCSCGKRLNVPSNYLTTGQKRSCGCWEAEHMAAEDLAGQRFGPWTALHATPRRARRHVVWACRCICGRIRLRSSELLKLLSPGSPCRCRSVGGRLPDPVRFDRWHGGHRDG